MPWLDAALASQTAGNSAPSPLATASTSPTTSATAPPTLRPFAPQALRISPVKASAEIRRVTDLDSALTLRNTVCSVSIAAIALHAEWRWTAPAKSLPGGVEWHDVSSAQAEHLALCAWVTGGASDGSQDFLYRAVLDLRVPDDNHMSQVKRITPDEPFPETESPGRRHYKYGTPWPLN
jgi:hypothetical protein